MHSSDDKHAGTLTPGISKIPPGFAITTGHNGNTYLVPTFAVPATQLAVTIEQSKHLVKVELAPGGIC